jgi:Domain of unknown function (DUF4150)
VPTPFPNIAQCADAIAGTCTQRVKIRNKAAIVEGTQIAFSSGDEAGVAMGVVSGTVANIVTYKRGTEAVVMEGKRAVIQTSLTAHNGANANQPCGQQTAPSQSQVFFKP